MKFSIVIRTYNRLSLLKRAINSALTQTENCEVIVVDDNSDDGTLEYLCRLKDNIVFFPNSPHKGINSAVKMAQGDWIKLLDDDDYLTPNCIESMIEAIKLHPQASICSCQAIKVDNRQKAINRTPPIGSGKAFYIPQADLHYGMLLEQVPFGTTSQVAVRRDAFLQSGGWNLSLDILCDDIDSWIRIAQFGDAIFINQYLVYRTVWSGSHNQKFSLLNRRDRNILMKEKIYDLVNEKYQHSIPPRRDIYNYIKLHWFLVAIKQNRFLTALLMASPAILSCTAWKLLFDAILRRKLLNENSNISKVLLI